MEPIMHQGYINILIIALAMSGYVIYSLVRENRHMKSIIHELKKSILHELKESHDPLRKHESTSTYETWETIRNLHIDPDDARREIKGRRDHAN